MIDKNKQYRTRDGHEVRIYATDGDMPLNVHGAIELNDGWGLMAWRNNGRLGAHVESGFDLIEVRPRIQREVWVNVYPGPICVEMRHTKADADDDAMSNRIACVRLMIDCEEGEGL